MKKYILILAVVCMTQILYAQAGGEKTFKTICSACHTIGKGKLVGPDLKGVHNKYDEKWIISFVRSSQTMVKKGDPRAVKIFNEFKIPMPDNNLTDAQIRDVIAYIKSKSPAPAPKPVVKPTTTTPTTKPVAPSTTTVAKPKVETETEWDDADIRIKAISATTLPDVKKLNADFWNTATPVNIPLNPQRVTYPFLPAASLPQAEIKCAAGKNFLAFRISWVDSSRNVYVDADKFCDQLAVQLPVDPGNIPSYMMGNPGGRVHIVHWKGIWQEDCENGFRDVQDAYPNMWVDIYPFSEGELDKSKRLYSKDITAENIVDRYATANMPGTYSKNPMSAIRRKVPVEEATAIGFGTLTTQETQVANGWAEWKDYRWTAIVIVPVNSGNIYKAKVNKRTKIALALWDGGKANIGGRKHYSVWADLYLPQ